MAADIPSVATNGGNQLQNGLIRTFQVVVAATQSMGIGKKGKLPWRLPSDMKFFKELTVSTSDPSKKNAVIMGRKTWESIPLVYRPLPARLNVVLTSSRSSNIISAENVLICSSMESALQILAASPYCSLIERIFVIGGGQVLRDTLNGPGCDAIHFTDIEREFECDTFLPQIDHSLFRLWYSSSPSVENNTRYSFETYVRVQSSWAGHVHIHDEKYPDKNEMGELGINIFSNLPKLIFERHEEYGYWKLVQEIILNGVPNRDMNGTGTLSKSDCQMRFNLRKTFPLLSTKNIFWQGIVEELLQFISGSTNAKETSIRIWDHYASGAFLDSIGLQDRAEGDLKPLYGFQWRHFGVTYTDMHIDYTCEGFDQLLDAIEKIKRNPNVSQIILSAWNPSDLKLMSVSSRCMFAQFHVANGELSCQMYQSSGEMELEIPVSIVYYSLLTCVIAHISDLRPGDFVYLLGDAYISKTHVRVSDEQFRKMIRPFPVLRINPQKKDIGSFVAEDFELIGYDPQQL